MAQKVIVLRSENGEVVGTQIGSYVHESAADGEATLVAGPRQTLTEIELDVPPLNTKADIDNYHRRLVELLR
jgi:hypothetical protein